MAGGRYDGLMSAMGGPEVPGVGWAAGIERLAMLLAETPAAARPVALVPIGVAAEADAWVLAQALRRGGVAVDLAFRGKPGQRMKRADRLHARHALFIGDDELTQGVVKLRDLDSGSEENVARDAIVARLSVS
jgi:histidyl-tRNA synthetase